VATLIPNLAMTMKEAIDTTAIIMERYMQQKGIKRKIGAYN